MPCLTLLVPAALVFAVPSPQEDLRNAVQKLAELAHYAWVRTSTTKDAEEPENRYGLEPLRGLTSRGAFTYFKSSTTRNGLPEPLEGAWSPERRISRSGSMEWAPVTPFSSIKGYGSTEQFFLRSLAAHLTQSARTPAEEAAELAQKLGALKAVEDGVLLADLPESLIRDLAHRSPGHDVDAEPRGTVRFWIKDGLLTRYEFTLEGKRDYGRKTIQRTTTIEIRDPGVPVKLPEDARKALE